MNSAAFLVYFVVSVAAGAATISLTRKWLDSRAPSLSAYLALIGAMIVILLLSHLVGISRTMAGNALVLSAFLGTQFSSAEPWSTRTLSASLAAAAGLIALLALLSSNLNAAAIALGVAGVLTYLSRMGPTFPESDLRRDDR